MKQLTADRRAQIVELYRRGEKLLVIEHLYGVTTSHISKLAKSTPGVRLRGRPFARRRRFRNKQGGRKLLTTGPVASPHG